MCNAHQQEMSLLQNACAGPARCFCALRTVDKRARADDVAAAQNRGAAAVLQEPAHAAVPDHKQAVHAWAAWQRLAILHQP